MEITERQFITKTLSRYLYFGGILLLFVFLSIWWYFAFQNFAVNTFSSIKYDGIGGDFLNTAGALFFFVVICFVIDYLMLKKYKQSQHLMSVLLLGDIICLLITNVVMIIYSNYDLKPIGHAEIISLNNVELAIGLISLKGFIADYLFKKRIINKFHTTS